RPSGFFLNRMMTGIISVLPRFAALPDRSSISRENLWCRESAHPAVVSRPAITAISIGVRIHLLSSLLIHLLQRGVLAFQWGVSYVPQTAEATLRTVFFRFVVEAAARTNARATATATLDILFIVFLAPWSPEGTSEPRLLLQSHFQSGCSVKSCV